MTKNIEQVIEIEKQAQVVSQAAVLDAEKIPLQAQEEAEALLEKTRKEAEQEAARMKKSANAEAECARILSEAEEQARQTREVTAQHLEQAIDFVIKRVSGK